MDSEVDSGAGSDGSIRERRESAGRLLEEAARLVRAGLGAEAQGVARTAFALLLMRDPPGATVIAIDSARARREKPDGERPE